jgi:SAM-dependent methyltransferase
MIVKDWFYGSFTKLLRMTAFPAGNFHKILTCQRENNGANKTGDRNMNATAQKVSIKGMRSDYSHYALTQHNAVQRGLGTAVEKLIEPAIGEALKNSLQIVDLGSADGVNGFAVIDRFANALGSHSDGSKPLLSVAHIDVPTADFKSLTDNIYNHPGSYYHALQDTFEVQPSLVPGSFYAPYLEAQFADIVFSTTALHYASRSAGPIRNHIEPLYAEGRQKLAWGKLSKADLDQILNQVYRCLKPGGCFWAVAPAHTTDANGAISNHWNREVWNVLIGLLDEMDRNGEIHSQTWRDFVIPVHQRHISEWQHWFDRNPDNFRLEFLEVVESENPYLALYRQEHRNPTQFADDYLGFFRAWGERIISTLIPDDRHQQAFFKRLHKAFESNPERFANDNVSVYVGAIKI